MSEGWKGGGSSRLRMKLQASPTEELDEDEDNEEEKRKNEEGKKEAGRKRAREKVRKFSRRAMVYFCTLSHFKGGSLIR